MIDNVAALLFQRLFKSDSVDSLYVVEKKPATNLPTIKFLDLLAATEAPCCQITLDFVEVLVDEGGLYNIAKLSCLMCIYYIHSIKYPDKLRNTLLYVQHYLLRIGDTTECPAVVKRLASIFHR